MSRKKKHRTSSSSLVIKITGGLIECDTRGKEQRFLFKMNERRFLSQVCIIRGHAVTAVCNIGPSCISELLRLVNCSFA